MLSVQLDCEVMHRIGYGLFSVALAWTMQIDAYLPPLATSHHHDLHSRFLHTSVTSSSLRD